MSKWVKGQSGNPGGRPKGLAARVKDGYAVEAFQIVVDIMRGRIDELAYDKDGKRITLQRA